MHRNTHRFRLISRCYGEFHHPPNKHYRHPPTNTWRAIPIGLLLSLSLSLTVRFDRWPATNCFGDTFRAALRRPAAVVNCSLRCPNTKPKTIAPGTRNTFKADHHRERCSIGPVTVCRQTFHMDGFFFFFFKVDFVFPAFVRAAAGRSFSMSIKMFRHGSNTKLRDRTLHLQRKIFV